MDNMNRLTITVRLTDGQLKKLIDEAHSQDKTLNEMVIDNSDILLQRCGIDLNNIESECWYRGE